MVRQKAVVEKHVLRKGKELILAFPSHRAVIYKYPCRLESPEELFLKPPMLDFPGGPMVENLLAIRETQVQALLWEDPTCRGAAKPGCQDC